MQKCISKSQEYGVLILDSFQHEPIFIFPKNFPCSFKPPHKVLSQEIINYRDIKCGLDIISQSYILVIILPAIPDHIIKQTLSETLQIVQPVFLEMAILQEDHLTTPKSTDRSVRNKKVLKPDLYEKLNELLEVFLSYSIYRIYPYFLYEDEEFEHSCINFQSVCLPIALGGVACSFNLSVPLMMRIDLVCNILYHESVVTVHEVLTLDGPSAVIKDFALIYKGYVIAGGLEAWELNEVMRMYNTNRLYLRNESYPQDTFVEKVKKDSKEIMISLLTTCGLTIAVLVIPINSGENDYDPWLVDRAKRLASDLYELKLLQAIENEFSKTVFRIEQEAFDVSKKQEFLDIMKKSRSLDSSPIGSPRAGGIKDKLYEPVYFPQHDLYIFHYALLDTHSKLINCPTIFASSKWFMNVMRPLFYHYALLYEETKNSSKEIIQKNVKFAEMLENESVAVIRFEQYLLFSMFRGVPEKLKQFAYEIAANNYRFDSQAFSASYC